MINYQDTKKQVIERLKSRKAFAIANQEYERGAYIRDMERHVIKDEIEEAHKSANAFDTTFGYDGDNFVDIIKPLRRKEMRNKRIDDLLK